MDCNKEEATRAKAIAEKKLEGKDFTGARKFVLKAQQLYPDMENIGQMLMVCDVHCAAEKKLFGNEMDWYGILQIEQTANEATIKKQYRKCALLLHPDKNNFIGAEGAFKLIGEAQRVLLDQEKRRLYDMRRKPTVALYRPPQRASPVFNVGVQNNFRNNFTSFNLPRQPPHQQAQSGVFHNSPSFWTHCPFCSVKYEYYKEVINRSLCCQNCKKPFVAYDMEGQGPPPVTNLNQTSFFQQQNSFNQGACRAEVARQGNSQSEKPRTGSRRQTRNTSSEKFSRKKSRKQKSESSESCETGSSSDFEENITDEDSDIHVRKDIGGTGEHHPRRSSRSRQKVSYNENVSDDDDLVITPKKAKRNKSSCTLDEVNESANKEEASKINNQSGSDDVNDDLRKMKQKENDFSEESLSRSKKTKVSHDETTDEDDYQRSTESDSVFNETSDSTMLSCRDPDFNDFDKLRSQECFKCGQIWAMYDAIDAMPRYYARIKKIFSSGFKIQVTWLELAPTPEGQSKCASKNLPVSCGEFVLGSTETLDNCGSMFSHEIGRERGSNIKIYPRKGETWALFRNWEEIWNSDSSCQYEYEFVEILSDYTKEAGIDVAPLIKVKGFSCLFCCMAEEEEKSFRIPAVELFRFSHQVLSFQLRGDEREDVPRGSIELDPAALPMNLPEVSVPKDLKEEAPSTLKSVLGSNGDAATHKANTESFQSEAVDFSARAASSEAFELPKTEFCDFNSEKSQEKFQIGQIWALYSDDDGLPKSYGQIKKITHDPEFEMMLTWLESCSLPHGTIEWRNNGMPISCGIFKTKRDKLASYNYTNTFSHLVRAIPTNRNEFSIYPSKGEVWALYKNWTPEIRCSDLEKCEYEVVEIIENNALKIEVLFLERDIRFNSVFKAELKGGSKIIMGITGAELLRFSHQIPAFRLSEEMDGSLRGFWELDPAAFPIHYFS